MEIAHFVRDERHLVILPEFPRWFIVDDFAYGLVQKLTAGIPVQQIVNGANASIRPEVQSTCEEIGKLLAPPPGVDIEYNESLTSKTTVAMIQVTQTCNLSCPHCYVDARASGERELSLNEHQTISNDVAALLATNPKVRYGVNLTGGEPFASPEIMSVVKAYRSAGLEVGISTNALLIKESYIQDLLDMSVVLSISLDGCTCSTHEAIRGPDTFDATIERIQNLVARGVKVGINFLLHSGNFHELEATISLAARLGCSGFNPINLVQLGRACDSQLTRVSEATAFRRLAQHLDKHPEEQQLFARTSIFSSLGAGLLAGVSCTSCGVGNRPCAYIDSLSNVYPCANTQRFEFLLGNLRETSLATCLRRDHPVLVSLRGLNVETINQQCAACEVRKFCGGDCRGETYSVTGSLTAPYVACEDRRQSILELIWIAAGQPEIFTERSSEFLMNADRGI